ncbi:helix-turn-helix domain-containing protein [Phytohabitans flavus]|uniref:helix-turn-helix domain-containing protein n=1 Tax=Phytohabitans flavus TaxID=1076124 RepID=UPI0036300C26
MVYGERIRQVREMHRMTQADLIKEVPSLTQSRLSRIEKDLATIDEESLALVAALTGVAVGFFARPPTPGFSVLSPQMRSRSRLTQGRSRRRFSGRGWSTRSTSICEAGRVPCRSGCGGRLARRRRRPPRRPGRSWGSRRISRFPT